jgi:hypothetical protein
MYFTTEDTETHRVLVMSGSAEVIGCHG